MRQQAQAKRNEEATERAIVPREKNLPGIPDDKLSAVIQLSDDRTNWVKIVEGGFKLLGQDKFVKQLVGKIVDVTPYLIKFESGVPTKIPNVTDDLEIPEGYERRCDVKLLVDDELFGLSLPPSSIRFYLSPYLKFLRNKNLRPENVLTRVTSKMASNSMGTWPVSVFELADTPSPDASVPLNAKGYPSAWD